MHKIPVNDIYITAKIHIPNLRTLKELDVKDIHEKAYKICFGTRILNKAGI